MDLLDETIARVAAGLDTEDEFIGPDDGPSSRSSSPSVENRNVNITQPVAYLYQCSPCLKQFLTKHGIESHQRKFHSSQSNDLIPTSKSTHSVQNSPVSSLSAPTCTPVPAQLICEACEMKFHVWPKLVEHMRQFHRDSYECCGLIFATQVGLDLHKAAHNNGRVSGAPAATAAPKSPSSSSSTPVIGNLTGDLDHKRFKCYVCKIEFRLRNTLKVHLQRVHEKTWADNKAFFEKEKEDSSVLYSEQRLFSGNRHSFRNASISKTVFLCSECVIVFYSKEELNEHKQKHHLNFSPPLPNVCISTPKPKGTPESHASDFQKRKEEISSENCPASVSIAEHTIVPESETLLQKNIYSSTNKKFRNVVMKKHKCPSCYKQFSSSLALTLHSNRIHQVPADLTYPCRICNLQFYTTFERNRHSKVHNKTIVYQCFICAKKYRWISDLQKHLRVIHGKTFTHRQDMEQPGVDNLPKRRRLEKLRMNNQVKKFHSNSSDSKTMVMDTNDDLTPSIVSVSPSNAKEDSNNKNAEPVGFAPIIISVTGSNIEPVAFKEHEHEEIHLDSDLGEKNGATVTTEVGLQEVYDKNAESLGTGTEAQDQRVVAEDDGPDGNSVLNHRDPLLTEIDLVSEPESEHEEVSPLPAKDTSPSREVQLLAHSRVHLVKKFKCHMCKMRFLTEPACKKHCLTRHREKKERKCPHPNCFSKFKSDDTYKAHLSSHKRKKISKCNFCSSEFTTEKDLNIHLKQEHFAPEKKFVCVSCDRRFDTVEELRTHEAVHKDNPWKCSACPTRFISEVALRTHEDSHKKGSVRSRNKIQESDHFDSDVEIISLD